jgi:hypothetical protein
MNAAHLPNARRVARLTAECDASAHTALLLSLGCLLLVLCLL